MLKSCSPLIARVYRYWTTRAGWYDNPHQLIVECFLILPLMVIFTNIINLYDNILNNKYQGLITCCRVPHYSPNLTMAATDDNMAERQAYRLTAPDSANLAATAYGWPVVILTDEGHAATFFLSSTVSKGTELTFLYVNSNQWHTAELTDPPRHFTPRSDAIWEHHYSPEKTWDLNATLPESAARFGSPLCMSIINWWYSKVNMVWRLKMWWIW